MANRGMNPVEPWPEIKPMSPAEFDEAVQRIGFARSNHPLHRGIGPAMEWLGMTPNAGMRYAKGSMPIPPALAALLRIMVEYDLKPKDVAELR